MFEFWKIVSEIRGSNPRSSVQGGSWLWGCSHHSPAWLVPKMVWLFPQPVAPKAMTQLLYLQRSLWKFQRHQAVYESCPFATRSLGLPFATQTELEKTRVFRCLFTVLPWFFSQSNHWKNIPSQRFTGRFCSQRRPSVKRSNTGRPWVEHGGTVYGLLHAYQTWDGDFKFL